MDLLVEYDFSRKIIKEWNDEFIRFLYSWTTAMYGNQSFRKNTEIKQIIKESYVSLHKYPYSIKMTSIWLTMKKICFLCSYNTFCMMSWFCAKKKVISYYVSKIRRIHS